MKLGTRKQSLALDGAASASDEIVVAGRVGVRDRVTARLRPGRLDLALAAGKQSEAAAALALRARRLTDLPHRRSIADALHRLVREAHEGAPPSYVRITPSRRRVAAASDELSLLAHALAQPGPVAARGVAQARVLLTDGTGPLYNPSSPASLQERATSAADNLRPWSA